DLARGEIQAVPNAPDGTTWSGHRDRALFAVMYNTGGRVSEVAGLRRDALTDGQPRSLRIRGKGRNERLVPLWKQTSALLTQWLRRLGPQPNGPLFPDARGHPLSPSRIEARRAVAVRLAAASGPSLRGKASSPPTIRHTTAMHLLQSGVDLTVIALWLGHESPETTHQYVEADLRMKEEVLGKATGVPTGAARYQ